MPKPNTRFLRHIIKDTNTHNKNLLARESAESKARLEGLEQAEQTKRLKTNPNTRDIRKRQMGDIHAILGGGGPRRRRDAGDDERPEEREERRSSSSTKDRRGHSTSKGHDLTQGRYDDRTSRGRLDKDPKSIRETDRRNEDRSRRRRDGSDAEEDEGRRKRRSKYDMDRSRSPGHRHHHSRHKPGSSESKQAKYRDRSPTRQHEGERSKRSSRRSPKRQPSSPSDNREDDSDPLEDLIGPVPAPRPRGRGALAGSSGIDRRFSETYDPKADIQMDGDGEKHNSNWDDDVEAYRDRQRLKQNQEARLKSAGFTDAVLQRSQGGGEKSEANVKWAKAGEKREWDRGKKSENEDEDLILGLSDNE